jgi:hypothetical protein
MISMLVLKVMCLMVLAAAGGAVGMFFALRNNKKYLNVDAMLKSEIKSIEKSFDAMKAKKIEELKAKKESIKNQVLVKINEIVKSI